MWNLFTTRFSRAFITPHGAQQGGTLVGPILLGREVGLLKNPRHLPSRQSTIEVRRVLLDTGTHKTMVGSSSVSANLV